MSECPFQSRLSAFHDRELDADTSRRLQSHLADCPACNETLTGIRAVSRLLNGVETGRLSQMGVARLHATADSAAKRRDIFPLAKTLIAIAASLFVITGAWLAEVPSHRDIAPGLLTVVRPEAEWETLAGGGKLELPRNIANETGFARKGPQDRFSDWMINSLKQEAGS